MTVSEDIPILPYPIDKTIAYVRVLIDNFQLQATDCWCSVYEYTSDDQFINMSRVYVPPDIYEHWGVDDDYLVNYCLETLGFERKPEVNIDFPE